MIPFRFVFEIVKNWNNKNRWMGTHLTFSPNMMTIMITILTRRANITRLIDNYN